MSVFRDIRYGFRSLIKSPALTIVAVFALTLGIGLTTTMFSIVYGALMRGLPFPDGDKVVIISRDNKARQITNSSIPITDIERYRSEQRSFTEIAALTSGTMNVSDAENKAERVDGSWVSANMFHLISVQPIAGRGFQPGDDTPNGGRVAVISYFLWENRFGKKQSTIHQNIRVNGVPYEIVGVMPENFAFPNNDKIWLPIQTDPLGTARDVAPQYQIVAKLKPGVSLDEASVDVAATQQRIGAEHKDTDKGFTASVQSFTDNYIGPQPRQLLYTMLGAVFFVLMIACTNVANLLVDRAAHRSREVGIRAALGASRAAIIRQFLAEAFLMSLAGALLGLVLANAGVALFNRSLAGAQVPFFIVIRLYPAVLVFAAAVALLATVLSGVIPAYQSSRTDINEILKDETRGGSSLKIGKISKALVMFEVALSCGLLVAAGLTIKSVTKLRTMDPGFATKTVFTARVGFPVGYTDTIAQRQFFEQLAERTGHVAGVQAAAMSSGLPGARQGYGGTNFAIDGKSYAQESDYPTTRTLSVTPEFFATLSIPLRTGRLLESGDRAGSLPVAVVNERFVQQFFGDKSPIGHRIRLGGAKSTEPWLTIVGVVPTVFGGSQADPRPAAVFRPLAQAHSNFAYISARTNGDQASLVKPIRDIASQLNPDIPLYWVMSLDDSISLQLWFVRVFGTMFMIFGIVALFLASVGLYAVMSFSVSRRTREVGIRMALGAQARDVVRMIFGQGLFQVGVGLIVGLAFALLISTSLSTILFDVQPRDPVVFGGVAALLAITGILACLIPARRATKVDPLSALRAE